MMACCRAQYLKVQCLYLRLFRARRMRLDGSYAARLLMLCVLVLGAARCTQQNPNLAFSVGSIPPPLKVSTLQGSPDSLDNYKGSVVLLNFWASWCAPCVSELPALERLYQRLKARGFVVLAVGIDDTAENLGQLVSKLGLTFPVAVDGADAKSDYRLTGVPETLLIGRDGRLLLMLDPDTGQASPRILGPRDWDDEEMVSRIASLLAH